VTKLGSSGELLYSTYLGGSKSTDGNTADDVGIGIAVDSTGNAYVAGQTCSSDFPTKNAFQSTFLGGQIPCDGFAAKLHPAGEGASDLIYSTYLGGATENDAALGIALDPSKLVYVMGQAGSSDFPTTTGAFQKTKNGSFDVFVSKLDMTKSGLGSLLYSTFLGGDAQEPNSGGGIAVDAFGMIYLTGTTVSDDFPTTSGAFQTSPSISPDPNTVPFNVFVTKLNPAGGGASDLLYSTYLGGTDSESAGGVAVGSTGNIYVAGSTCSADFPHTTSAFQSSLRGRCDGFVAKLNPAGGGSSDLVYSTFFGGDDNDFASAIALDSTGNAAVSGSTSSADLPHTADAAQTGFGGGLDGFVALIPIGNFSISPIASIAADVAGTGTSTVTVNSIDEFNAPVSLSVSGQPTGVTASLNPTSVTPSAGSSAASTLTVNLGLTATPGTFSLALAGTSGLLTHSVSAQVTVQASTSGTTTVIDGLGNAGCIDNSGISGTLIAKLAQAQDDIDAGRIQDAINTLNALLNQLLAQSGKHIFASCTIDGQTFNPAEVLINDVRAILATLQA
jgi:beta-propeller repeat-containing protein